MNILILAECIGKTAPGIVFERLMKGLSTIHSIDVLTVNDFSSSSLDNVNIHKIKYLKLHPRIVRFFISVFKVNFLDIFYSKRIARKKLKKYDLIFSFVSFSSYISLITGYEISKRQNTKFAIYSVDAIPAPLGWSKNDMYFRSTKKMINKYFGTADYLASANQKMLDYQLSIFTQKKGLITDVIYNPSLNIKYNYKLNNANLTFLYTGGIYGARKVDFLFGGFKMLLKEYPSAKLVFVGSCISSSNLSVFSETERKHIEIYPYTNKLEHFYEDSLALIDIDADLENDVFLSSKIVNYLTINRMIICETGVNSPSRDIFKDINSIIQCDHNSYLLFQGMKKCILNCNAIDYSDRNKSIEKFELTNVVTKLNDKIILLSN